MADTAGEGGAPGTATGRLTAPDRPLDLRFDALWKGIKVGAYTFTVTPAPAGGLSVAHALTIKVKIGFITAYRYVHQASEVWQDGRLQHLRSDTDDDGDQLRLTAKAEGGEIVLDGPQGRSLVRGDLLTTTCAWHPAFVAEAAILDAAEGRVVPLQASILARRCERIGGRECVVTDHRFATARLSGELSYAEGGFLLAGHLDRKGHQVRFVPAG
jgi:hypothetical protein